MQIYEGQIYFFIPAVLQTHIVPQEVPDIVKIELRHELMHCRSGQPLAESTRPFLVSPQEIASSTRFCGGPVARGGMCAASLTQTAQKTNGWVVGIALAVMNAWTAGDQRL